jgi:hypothetical protein
MVHILAALADTMKWFDLFQSLFGSGEDDSRSSLEELNKKLAGHPILRHQVEEIDSTLTKYVQHRVSNRSSNLGLSLNAPEGAGKTHFIIEFLRPFFMSMRLIRNDSVFKLSNRKFVHMHPTFYTIVDVASRPEELENSLASIRPGGILMIDDFHAKNMVLPLILEGSKRLLLDSRHDKTLLMLSGGFQRLKHIREAFDIEGIFPADLELKFSAPSLNQLVDMFLKYAASKGISVRESAVPTLKFYFRLKQESARMSQDLFREHKVDSRDVVRFVYAKEFEGLVSSILSQGGDDLDIYSLKECDAFLDLRDQHKRLLELRGT